MLELRPDFGYYPEPKKTFLVTDAKSKRTATELFSELGVKVVTSQRFL